MHLLACHNPNCLEIQYRDRCPFLEPEHGDNNYDNDSNYAPSDNDKSDNKDEGDDNQSDHSDNDNLYPTPDQDMAQGHAGVTIHDN